MTNPRLTNQHITLVKHNNSPYPILLGEGYSSKVFLGTFTGSDGSCKEVALKRVQHEDRLEANDFQQLHHITEDEIINSNRREKDAFGKLNNHPNIVKCFYIGEDDNFSYFALELCAASLDKRFSTRNRREMYSGPMPSNPTTLLHITKGVRYIHSQGLAHRNINPKNILISSTDPVLIKLTDIGLSKPITFNGSYSVSGNHVEATCWMAPEMLEDPEDEAFSERRGSIASDTFSTGCVFFYILTSGWHPFGDDSLSIKNNVISGNPVNINNFDGKLQPFKELISQMILNNPGERIALDIVETRLQEELDLHQLNFDFYQ